MLRKKDNDPDTVNRIHDLLHKAEWCLNKTKSPASPARKAKPEPTATHPIEVVVCVDRTFYLSETARTRFHVLSGKTISPYGGLPNGENILRTDPHLIATIRELGESAGGVNPLHGLQSRFDIMEVPWGAYYVVYPYGERVFANFSDAIDDTYDWELDMVEFRTNRHIDSTLIKTLRTTRGLTSW
jgi:hypothetical protein